MPSSRFRVRETLRQLAGAALVDNFFRGSSRIGRAAPRSRPERHGVEVIEDIPYLRTGRVEHTLDVYRPVDMKGPLPVVLYVHGGGFRILSKETHWVFGLLFARKGYLVFNINYRLAPTFPYPAAIEDVASAYRWVLENAHLFGGDEQQLVVAGESAGANLVTSLTLASCFKRDEPFARHIWEGGVVPKATLAACGLFEVGNHERYKDHGFSRFTLDRIAEVGAGYRGRALCPEEWLALCDPLTFLERAPEPDRALPPFFLPCGTWDPLLDDTRRMRAVLEGRGVPCEAPEYARGPHAFHAFVPWSTARRCWDDHYSFIDRALAPARAGEASPPTEARRPGTAA